MCRCFILVCVFLFSALQVSADTFVHYNIAGRPVSSVGHHLQYQRTVNRPVSIVKYNLAGSRPISMVGKPMPIANNGLNVPSVSVSPPYKMLNSPVTSVHKGPRRIGGAKTSRVMASRCSGITYYKDGVATCAFDR